MHKEIFSDGTSKLFVGFNGLTENNKLTQSTLSLSIYVIDDSALKHIYSAKLNYKQTVKLFSHLKSVSIIADDSKTETGTFIEVSTDSAALLSAIEKVDATLVKGILEKAPQTEKLKLILQALSQGEIQDLEASIKQANHKRALAHLKLMLNLADPGDIVANIKKHPDLSPYAANQPEKIFQNWIEQNTWTLGIDLRKAG